MKNSLILHPHYSNGNGHSTHIPELVFEQEKSPYIATPENPFHFSVGALVFNHGNQILAHHYENFQTTKKFFPNLYTLMQESMELNETPENTLTRGLKEEFGMKGEVRKLLGSLTTTFLRGTTEVQKTTLYFSVFFISNGEERDMDSCEGKSALKWCDPDFLIRVMEEQGKEEKNQDQSEIVRRFLKYR